VIAIAFSRAETPLLLPLLLLLLLPVRRWEMSLKKLRGKTQTAISCVNAA
jgi:hypothetical protein